jgi:diadenosine tetraphosphate (Ap4A) HIT family hydrolase
MGGTRVESFNSAPCLIYSSRHAKRHPHGIPAFVNGLSGLEVACPFCELPTARIVARNEHGVVIRDAYPVTPGHTLVIPIRHVGSFFELRPDERGALWALLDQANSDLDGGDSKPDGYNIGNNDGPAAGQTVPHLHIHLIPRRSGDLADPRGGVRWVIPEKAAYWENVNPVASSGDAS